MSKRDENNLAAHVREVRARNAKLVAEVRDKLPGFARCCLAEESDTILLSQAAFAGQCQEEELALMAKAIRFAGLMGKHVTVVCTDEWLAGEERRRYAHLVEPLTKSQVNPN